MKKICVIDVFVVICEFSEKGEQPEERMTGQRLCDHPGQGILVEVCEGVVDILGLEGPGWPVPYVAGTGEDLQGRTGLREEQPV